MQNFSPHINLEYCVSVDLTEKSAVDERGHRLRFLHASACQRCAQNLFGNSCNFLGKSLKEMFHKFPPFFVAYDLLTDLGKIFGPNGMSEHFSALTTAQGINNQISE